MANIRIARNTDNKIVAISKPSPGGSGTGAGHANGANEVELSPQITFNVFYSSTLSTLP